MQIELEQFLPYRLSVLANTVSQGIARGYRERHDISVTEWRILAVLEPRSNTMRLGVMRDRLAESLAAADRSYVYGANLGWDAGEALRALGERGRNFRDLGSLVEAVVADARAGDHVVVMSNGGFGGVHGKLLSALGARAAA